MACVERLLHLNLCVANIPLLRIVVSIAVTAKICQCICYSAHCCNLNGCVWHHGWHACFSNAMRTVILFWWCGCCEPSLASALAIFVALTSQPKSAVCESIRDWPVSMHLYIVTVITWTDESCMFVTCMNVIASRDTHIFMPSHHYSRVWRKYAYQCARGQISIWVMFWPFSRLRYPTLRLLIVLFSDMKQTITTLKFLRL
jgi:hypothetical protein